MEVDQNIYQIYEDKYTAMLQYQLEQTRSNLDPFVTVISDAQGDLYRLPTTVGSTELNRMTQRMQEAQPDELTFGQRWMSQSYYEKFLQWSTLDPDFLVQLPLNSGLFVKALGDAAQRAKDYEVLGTVRDMNPESPTYKHVIVREYDTIDKTAVDGSPYKGGSTGGYFGDNYCGKRGEMKVSLPQQPMLVSGTSVIENWSSFTKAGQLDYDRSNVIPVNFKSTGTLGDCGLTLDKLMTIGEMAMSRHMEGELVMAITPKQVADLRREEKLQKQDFGFQSLRTGWVQELFGIKFVVTPAVPIVNVGTSSDQKWVRACPVWRKSDLWFGTWSDSKFHMRPPVGKMIDQMLVGITMGMGAARTREESCITVHCAEDLDLNKS